VAEGGDLRPFYLQDDCGLLLSDPPARHWSRRWSSNRPAGGRIRSITARDRPGRSPTPTTAGNSARSPSPCTPVYVMGQAREREDVVAAEIAADPRR